MYHEYFSIKLTSHASGICWQVPEHVSWNLPGNTLRLQFRHQMQPVPPIQEKHSDFNALTYTCG